MPSLADGVGVKRERGNTEFEMSKWILPNERVDEVGGGAGVAEAETTPDVILDQKVCASLTKSFTGGNVGTKSGWPH